ncbi:MAG: alginate export family protein [Nitrospirae bacterium]|nr:alginate export family protein [Nitrospirota bacterium]
MKGFSNGLKLTTAAVLLVTMTAAPAFAAKTTPATDKNSAVPAVPRAIPNLIPYHKFDPPTSKLFDINKLNITGDIRVRMEGRNSGRFGLATAGAAAAAGTGSTSRNNDFFVQQWVRLGIHYTISPDVVFFFQPQYSKNWGGAANDPNSGANTGVTGATGVGNEIFARQAFMLIRNLGVKNLTAKIGRQLVVWGNHRMFGHFDWNNIGWAFDGATLDYKAMDNVAIQAGWLRVREGDCGGAAGTNSGGGGCSGGSTTGAGADANIIYLRAPMKFAGVVIEPTYIWHDSGTGGALSGNRPSNQSRHTIGGRVTTKRAISKVTVDVTGEGYYQFGEIAGLAFARTMDIEAYAMHIDAGVTLPVPMQPRIGGEFNIASGDQKANTCTTNNTASPTTCNNEWRGFDQLFPTNHIHFGYMDRMSWKNMIHFAANLNLRPTKNSHLEISGHKFYLNETNDNWYGANQAIFVTSKEGNTEDDLGSEVDVVYTMFFTPGNHVAWQIGGGVFMPGDFIDGNTSSAFNGVGVANETWGYTQLWINW